MIDNSRICVVYYNPDYTPPRRKATRKSLTDCQPKSGTKLAYGYALRKCKTILLLRKEK